MTAKEQIDAVIARVHELNGRRDAVYARLMEKLEEQGVRLVDFRKIGRQDVYKRQTKKIPHFDFEVPTELPGVDPAILDPRDTYADPSEWEKKAQDLASRFIKNFAKYEGNEAGKKLVEAGPKL